MSLAPTRAPAPQRHRPRRRDRRRARWWRLAESRWIGLLAGGLAVLLVGIAVALLASGSDPSQDDPAWLTPTASPKAPAAGPSSTVAAVPDLPRLPPAAAAAPVPRFVCPPATVRVSTADQLQGALSTSTAGSVIQLADGQYRGQFSVTGAATQGRPSYLCGGPGAVLDGGSLGGGYVMHLDGASNWRLAGFTVQHGQKGIVLDGVTGVALQDLVVQQIGDEAVHLRRGSSRNVVRGLRISDTGLAGESYGEGIYVGSSKNNWCELTSCLPDRSDGNFLLQNSIRGTTAEAVDVKEGTSGGVLAANVFDGRGIRGADSWVDIKGNGWRVLGNRGEHAPLDGYQTHTLLPGWGEGTVFEGNSSTVDAAGFAIHVTRPGRTTVRCDNTVGGAAGGLSNIRCS